MAEKKKKTKKKSTAKKTSAKSRSSKSGSRKSTSKKGKSAPKRDSSAVKTKKQETMDQIAERERQDAITDNIFGVVFIGIGIFLFAAVQFNRAGKFGEIMGEVLRGTFGLLGLVLPWYLIFFGALLFTNRTLHISIRSIVSSIMIFMMLCLVNSGRFIDAAKLKHGIDFNFVKFYETGNRLESGGIFGMPLSLVLTRYFGKVGLYVTALLVIAICLLLVINTPVSRFIEEGRRKKVLKKAEREDRKAAEAAMRREAETAESMAAVGPVGEAGRAEVIQYTDSAAGASGAGGFSPNGGTSGNANFNPEFYTANDIGSGAERPFPHSGSANGFTGNYGADYGEKNKKKSAGGFLGSLGLFKSKKKQNEQRVEGNRSDSCFKVSLDTDTASYDNSIGLEEAPEVRPGFGLDGMPIDASVGTTGRGLDSTPPATSAGTTGRGLDSTPPATSPSTTGRGLDSTPPATSEGTTGRGLDGIPIDIPSNRSAVETIGTAVAAGTAAAAAKGGSLAAGTAAAKGGSLAAGTAAAATTATTAAAATAATPEEKKPAIKKLKASDIPVLSDDEIEAKTETPDYIKPPEDLLGKPVIKHDENLNHVLKERARVLEETLENFNINAKVIRVTRGPTVTRYEIQPGPGVKVGSIVRLSDDIALNIRAKSIRMEAPIPGKAAIGIEVENESTTPVRIREIIGSREFKEAKSKISFAVGRDIAGKSIVADLKGMPHLLIAGSTGSGKSVCINSIIVSMLYNATPEEVKLILIDPKVVELGNYNGIPHLMLPVVTDPAKAAATLNWAVSHMTERYKKFAEERVRDIEAFNDKMRREERKEEVMPEVVIIIDELADLMMASPKQVEESICRLAQMARAAGMHLIVATQRPSVDIITGVIKANIPSRIAFAVSSQFDSRTIIDMGGAEKLVGKGDMLFSPIGASKPVRIQGCFISDKEVENVLKFIKQQVEPPEYSQKLISKIESAGSEKADPADEQDELLSDAADFVVKEKKASTSMLQRRFRIGYNRAARITDDLEANGIIGPQDGSRPRTVLMTEEELETFRNPPEETENETEE